MYRLHSMDYDAVATAVVIDNGTYTCKAGFSGDDEPQSVVRTVCSSQEKDREGSCFVGQKAVEKAQDEVSLRYPISHGTIRDWDGMENVWDYIFKQLEAPSDEFPVLQTEVPLSANANREKMAQIMFERFHVPAFYGAMRTVLPLYASGDVNGVVLDCGEGCTHVIPVYEGYAVYQCIVHSEVGGALVCEHLESLLSKTAGRKDIFKSYGMYSKMALLHDMKEHHCYVSLDYARDSSQNGGAAKVRTYLLPDGTEVQLEGERFEASELLFQPKVADRLCMGVHTLIQQAVKRSDRDIQNLLASRIVLSGGTSLLPGFPERMEKELASLPGMPSSNSKKSSLTGKSIVARSERKYASWIGGSVLASLSTFQDQWVSREQYDEIGPSVVLRKCFI